MKMVVSLALQHLSIVSLTMLEKCNSKLGHSFDNVN